MNSFLREIQQGNIPDVPKLSENHHIPFSPSLEDMLMTATNRHGDTPLLVAARCGQLQLLKQFHVDYGVPLSQSNSDGKTALHEAAQSGQVECVRYLIQAGASVDCIKRADWLVCTHYIIMSLFVHIFIYASQDSFNVILY